MYKQYFDILTRAKLINSPLFISKYAKMSLDFSYHLNIN